MVEAIFDSNNWQPLPFQFWALVFFVFGSVVGSFLNVCIHRMPLGQSIVSPPSHCPHCQYSIPWYLNVPLITWLWLRGKCRNCAAPISPRYFLVELLTGCCFLAVWLAFGDRSALLALVYCVFLAGLIVATFIDFEHFIIPDEVTLGGIAAGVLLSFLVPAMHGQDQIIASLKGAVLGALVGAGVIYTILRLGKLLFGRQKVQLESDTRVFFTETGIVLPGKEILYGDLFYRASDVIVMKASFVEIVDRCYRDAMVRLTPKTLKIGDDTFNPEEVHHLEAVTGEITLPREAMGFGDVKFMSAIGAFLGWPAVIFSLLFSSVIGAAVGVSLIAARKREWSHRLPYGPYIALAAAVWIFLPADLQASWVWNLRVLCFVFFRIPLPAAAAAPVE